MFAYKEKLPYDGCYQIQSIRGQRVLNVNGKCVTLAKATSETMQEVHPKTIFTLFPAMSGPGTPPFARVALEGER